MLHRVLAACSLLLITVTLSAQWADPAAAVPAYNAAPPPNGTKLPPVLPKEQLWGENSSFPYQTHAYELAAKIPAVLHQQPCYCYCDRMGHNSLHSCFETTHGAQCSICLKEAYYAYGEHQHGKTATQIRKGIMAGEWKKINLETSANLN